jgi:hypothetical protein
MCHSFLETSCSRNEHDVLFVLVLVITSHHNYDKSLSLETLWTLYCVTKILNPCVYCNVQNSLAHSKFKI